MDAEAKTLEEWRLLQSIVARKERLVFQVRGYCYVLLVVLGTAIFDAKTRLSEWTLLYIAYLVVFAFFAVEVSHRVVLRRAIDRSRRVEYLLREGRPYDGPRLWDALTARVTWREVWQCSGSNEMAWVPAAVSLIAISIFAIHKWW
ncbi:MAG: hypothetical protein GEV05_23845 [Betaproteobacteria bacterium]|nr:hypothetical protein [Betaproteobacteria bacterium]